jgi:hypothetical protein
MQDDIIEENTSWMFFVKDLMQSLFLVNVLIWRRPWEQKQCIVCASSCLKTIGGAGQTRLH